MHGIAWRVAVGNKKIGARLSCALVLCVWYYYYYYIYKYNYIYIAIYIYFFFVLFIGKYIGTWGSVT